VALEHLDHRQLLSVNFTGNVPIDFPATRTPGVVVIPDNPSVQHPQIAPSIKPIIKVTGFDISGIRVSYDSADDTLNIGLDQPLSQQPGRLTNEVIAGDADNNGSAGTVNPAVSALEPGFQEFFDMGGSQQMGAFLDLTGSGKPDIVAGFPPFTQAGLAQKQYEVATVAGQDPTGIPIFGTALPNNTGNIYLVNSPLNPNLEFNIAHFSELYQAETGKPLSATSTIGIGAFGASQTDIGISDAFFPSQPFQLGPATIPPVVCPPPPPPPPLEPRILINPHEHRHVNTAHPTDIRVNIFGAARFDVNTIIPQSVTLGGAHPIFSLTRHINGDQYLDETFVFRGSDITLPPGITDAHVTGQLTTGQTFDSVFQIFNRDKSYYSPFQIARQQAKQQAEGAAAFETPGQKKFQPHDLVDLALEDAPVPANDSSQGLGGPVVSIQRRNGVDISYFQEGVPVPVSVPTDAVAPSPSSTDATPVVSVRRRPSGMRRSTPLKVIVPQSASGASGLAS
jgi:hypothetical protein